MYRVSRGAGAPCSQLMDRVTGAPTGMSIRDYRCLFSTDGSTRYNVSVYNSPDCSGSPTHASHESGVCSASQKFFCHTGGMRAHVIPYSPSSPLGQVNDASLYAFAGVSPSDSYSDTISVHAGIGRSDAYAMIDGGYRSIGGGLRQGFALNGADFGMSIAHRLDWNTSDDTFDLSFNQTTTARGSSMLDLLPASSTESFSLFVPIGVF